MRRADLTLLAIAAIWGATFVVVKISLAFVGPFSFLALRFVLATVIASVVLLSASRRRQLTWPLVWAGCVLGLLLCVGYALQTIGLQLTSATRAAFIMGFVVVLVPLQAAVFLRRPVEGRTWLAALAALAGVALLSGGQWEVFSATTLGDVLVLGCAVVFAVHMLAGGEFAPRFDPFVLSLVQLTMGSALSLLVALALERPPLDGWIAVLPAAVFTGVFATVLAYTLQLHAQRSTSASRAALIFATEPVFGALFAYLLAGEVLTPPAAGGCVLILAGMLLARAQDAETSGR